MTTKSALSAFVHASRGYLVDEYPAKIELATARLSVEDLWWRPNAASNSIGTLLLHLAGNLRQWVVHGVGGRPDVRDRASEFEARDPAPGRDELIRVLRASCDDAGTVLDELDPDSLGDPLVVQNLEVTKLEAIYHAVEHFSMHTGQILWIVKLRAGADLGFYDVDEKGDVRETRW